MAVWQFRCNIIPLQGKNDNLCRDEMISWKGVAPPTINIDFLKYQKSWSTNIVQYGKIEETCIEFIYEKEKLEEIECRLDLRTLTRKNLIQIVEYVKNINALFLVDDKVYSSDIETMIGVMKQSKAYQYCKNPVEFLVSTDFSL